MGQCLRILMGDRVKEDGTGVELMDEGGRKGARGREVSMVSMIWENQRDDAVWKFGT